MKIITTEDIIDRSIKVHGYKYSYEKTIYNGSEGLICIICPIHGEFWQRVDTHTKGNGCKQCAKISMKNKVTKTIEKFIKEANIIHNNFYDYSKSIYLGDKNKLTITCLFHGDFQQIAGNHLAKHGCPKCHTKSVKTLLKTLIKSLTEKHNDYYDYSLLTEENIKSENKIPIICPKHGLFYQKQATHLIGRGCVKCSFITIANKTNSNVTEFIEKAKKIHGNKYNYSKVEYKNANTKVTIICKEHGEFKQNPRGHLSNNGCPFCNRYVGYSKSQWINYNKDKEGIFYIIKVFDENEIFYKIGITGKSIQERYKYTGNIPYNYEIIKEIKSKDLEYIWNLEKENKRILKDFKYKPLKSFAGSSVECFSKLNEKMLKLN